MILRYLFAHQRVARRLDFAARQRRNGSERIEVQGLKEIDIDLFQSLGVIGRRLLEVLEQSRNLAQLVIQKPLFRPPLRLVELIDQGKGSRIELARHDGPGQTGNTKHR